MNISQGVGNVTPTGLRLPIPYDVGDGVLDIPTTRTDGINLANNHCFAFIINPHNKRRNRIMNTTDRRVKRTKKLLADALAALMKQKPLKSITVRELTELADLNRGTFYLHFKDVYDLAEQIENGIFDRFNEIIADFDSSKNETLEVMESSQTLRFFLTRLFELLADSADMAQSLIGVNGDPAFIEKLKSRLEQRSYSTLYNALLQLPEGISIIYRHTHGPSGATYAPHGVDAAVGRSSPTSGTIKLNLEFQNTFDFPITIDCTVQNGALCIAIRKGEN